MTDDDYKEVCEKHLPKWLEPDEYKKKQRAIAERKRRAASIRKVLHRHVARAIFDASLDPKGKRGWELLTERLNEQWTSTRYFKWTAKKEVKALVEKLQDEADKMSLHHREKLIATMFDVAHFDRRLFYNEVPYTAKVKDEDGNKIEEKRFRYELKPMSQWPKEASYLFDGLDWKIPKGRDPIPVLKLRNGMAAIEKLGKDLKLWVERHSVENTDGTPFQVVIQKFSEDTNDTSE